MRGPAHPERVPVMMTTSSTPTLTTATPVDPDAAYIQRDWALLLNRHEDTLKRARQAGRYPNAYQDTTTGRRTWLIPVADVVAAGDLPAERVADRLAELDALKESRAIAAIREQLAEQQRENARLHAELAAAVARAETAEAEKRNWQAMATSLVKKVA